MQAVRITNLCKCAGGLSARRASSSLDKMGPKRPDSDMFLQPRLRKRPSGMIIRIKRVLLHMSYTLDLVNGAKKTISVFSNVRDSQTYTVVSFKASNQKIILEI